MHTHQHLLDVTIESSVYKKALDDVKKYITTVKGIVSPLQPVSSIPHNATLIKVHYSFDMAQQVFFTQTTPK